MKLKLNRSTHLNCFVKYAASNLHNLEILFLLIARAFDVCHPAAMILLTGIDKIAHRAILIENLRTTESVSLISDLPGDCTKPNSPKQRGCARDTCCTYLPHEIVVLEEIYMLGWNDPASERTHLGASFYPGFGEDAKTFPWDGALRNDDFTWQHQAGEFLDLWK